MTLTSRRMILLAVVCLTVTATFLAGRRLGMETRISTRHAYYSLPWAVSRLHFGQRGYVILRDVAEVFIKANPNVSNGTLRQALSLHPDPDRVMLFPADDKGDADFATLSFALFGPTVEGLYYTWFALFAVPIAIYVAVYWREPGRLAALAILLLAVYVSFFALPLTAELFSIHNPRAFGIVSLVPVLHLIFAVLDRQRPTALHVAAAAVQVASIAFSTNVRTTELWQVFSVAGVATAAALVERGRTRLLVLWPALALVTGIAVLELYQRLSYDRVYTSTHIQHRIFWHNVGIGFALNHALAAKYNLAVDDQPMMNLVRQRLTDTGRAAEIGEVFRPPGHEEYAFYGIANDYAHYERVAREVVGSIVWRNKKEALETFAFDKPRVLFRQLVWAAGYGGYSTSDLYLTGQAAALASDADRHERRLYLDPARPWVLAAVVAVALLSGGSVGQAAVFCAVAVWICAMSLLPALVAYPIISALGVSLATVPLVVLSLVMLVVRAAAGAWKQRGRDLVMASAP